VEKKDKKMKEELKIGIFIAIALVIFAALAFIVGDLSMIFKKKGYPLYVSFSSVAGLEKGAVVRLAGVKIGYVDDIRLKGSQAQVLMDISNGAKVPKKSKATLAALGLLGEKYIEIMPGDDPKICQPEDAIEGIPPVSLDQMGGLLFSIGSEVKEVGEVLKEMLGAEESQSSFRNTLQNLSSLTGELNEFFETNKEEIRKGLQNSSQAVEKVEDRVEKVSQNINDLILMLKETIEENRGNIKINLESIKNLIEKTEKSLKLLNDSLEKMNRGEGTLGKLIHKPDLYHKAEGTVSDIERIIRPLSSFKIKPSIRSDYYGQSNTLKSYLSLTLWSTPQNYFLTQIVHDPWLDKFRYSAQGGIRWGSFSSRAGIMESEIGVGIDYFAFGDRLKFSLESLDFNRKPRPRFRFWTRFTAAKNIFFLLGIDDFTLAPEREFFFGLGLSME
jgi:virulence factor Mce-like protein